MNNLKVNFKFLIQFQYVEAFVVRQVRHSQAIQRPYDILKCWALALKMSSSVSYSSRNVAI